MLSSSSARKNHKTPLRKTKGLWNKLAYLWSALALRTIRVMVIVVMRVIIKLPRKLSLKVASLAKTKKVAIDRLRTRSSLSRGKLLSRGKIHNEGLSINHHRLKSLPWPSRTYPARAMAMIRSPLSVNHADSKAGPFR